MMDIDITTIVRDRLHEELTSYCARNKTGMSHLYLIMNTNTRDIICTKGNMICGVNTAIDESVELGRVLIVK